MNKVQQKVKKWLDRALGLHDLIALEESFKVLAELPFLEFKNYQDMWEVTVEWTIGETRNLAGTASTLDKRLFDEIDFTTVMPQSGRFSEQWHLRHEYCFVIEGELMDELDPERRVYRAGEMMYFEPKKRHKPVNPSKERPNKLKVLFRRHEQTFRESGEIRS